MATRVHRRCPWQRLASESLVVLVLVCAQCAARDGETFEVAEGELTDDGSSDTGCDSGMEKRAFTVRGLNGSHYLAGVGVSVSGDFLFLKHQSGTSLTRSCKKHYGPWDLTQLRLLEGSVSFTVDLSHVGCACNLAFYLVSAPARDVDGIPIAGNNTYAPGNYYCDANKVGGQWCPEVDIMEANNHAFQATPHKCDEPVGDRHYEGCDRAGCSQNTKYMQGAYGPGSGFTIDTTKKFDVRTEFAGHDNILTGMTTILQQGGKQVVLDHSNCDAGYLAALSQPMAAGMSLRVTYWGDKAKTMSWMDQPPCGEEVCKGDNAGLAVISNVVVKSSPGVKPKPKPKTPPPVHGAKRHSAFNCSSGLKDWRGWAPAKVAFCCTHGNGMSCAKTPLRAGPIRWSSHPSKCLTVAKAARSPTADSDFSLIIWDCKGGTVGASQGFISRGDGLIRWSAHPNLCVDTGSPGTANGTLVKFQKCSKLAQDGGPQSFSFPSASTKIERTGLSRMCLDVANHSGSNGNRIQLWECLEGDDDQVFSWEVDNFHTPPPATTALVPTLPVTQPPTTTMPVYIPPPITTTTAPAAFYDCLATRMQAWSYRKKLWCCRHMNMGCPVRIPAVWVYDPVVAYPAHIRSLPRIDGPRTNGMLNPGDMFRVSQGLEGSDGILYLKLADGRGWFFDRMPGVGVMSVEYRAPTTSSSDINCAIWYPGEEATWSQERRTFCCQQTGRGCPAQHVKSKSLILHTPMQQQTPPPIPQFAFDCNPLLLNAAGAGWSVDESSWCCLHRGIGCTTTTGLMPYSLSDCVGPGGQGYGQSPECQTRGQAVDVPAPAYAQAYALGTVLRVGRGCGLVAAVGALLFGLAVAGQRLRGRMASARHHILQQDVC